MFNPPFSYLSENQLLPLWILMGVYFVSEALTAHFKRAGGADRTDDRGSLRMFARILPAAWIVAVALAGPPWGFFGSPALYHVALLVIGAGQLLRWWSIATLGRLFTVNVAIRTEHHLIATGPYRYVRHPSYAAIFMVHVGTALCLGSVASVLALTLPLLFTLVNRMRVEEDVLTAGLGPVYRDYMSRTKRLIPGVY